MNFACAKCGYCCTLNVILTEKEIKQIKKTGFTDFYVKDNENNTIIKRKDNGDCLFLNRHENTFTTTSCQIYSLRPSPCKNYPPYEQNQPCKEFNPRVRAYLYRTRDKS